MFGLPLNRSASGISKEISFLSMTFLSEFKGKQFQYCKCNCNSYFSWDTLCSPFPNLEESYVLDMNNKDDIKNNISKRKGIGDIDKVLELYSSVKKDNRLETKDLLTKEVFKIPNKTHPDIINYGEVPQVIKTIGEREHFIFKPYSFQNLTKPLNVLKNEKSNFTGHRSYFLCGQLAELESALIKYSLSKLLQLGYQLISVPDIIHTSVIKSCGMETSGKRSQVYSLDSASHGNDKSLSGTAEMSLAAYLMNKSIPINELPVRLAAVSRCFRAETSRTSDERGIYRVHQFTKVEMFGVSEPEKSTQLLDEFREFQVEHFSNLGLHLRVLDMPPHELGAQAYRKYDVEAWLPGKNMWGEVSSCSNCTDYQSRRLAITSSPDGTFVHTVNGTACAVPRLLIALFETHQQADGSVLIPACLQPYMGGSTVIDKESNKLIPRSRPVKKPSTKS